MLSTSLAAFRYNAILECNGFIICHLFIDNGGSGLAIQQRHVVPRHKVHFYLPVTVLKTKYSIYIYYPLYKQTVCT